MILVGFIFYITILYVSLVIYRLEYVALPRLIKVLIEAVVWGMVVLLILSSPYLLFTIFWWFWKLA